jgi:hypothetical protein
VDNGKFGFIFEFPCFWTCMVYHISLHYLQNVMTGTNLSEWFTWGFMIMVHHGQQHSLLHLSVVVNIFSENSEALCRVYLWQNTFFFPHLTFCDTFSLNIVL